MLEQLIDIGRRVLAQRDLGRLLDTAMDGAVQITGAERGLILLFDARGEVRFQTARNLEQADLQQPKYEVSRSIIEKVRTENVPVYLRNARDDPAFEASRSVSKLKILSVICLPLFHESEMFGAIYLDNRTVRGAFKPEHFEFAQQFADFISAAAHHAVERQQLEVNLVALQETLRREHRFDAIVGRHPATLQVLELVAQVADTDATVLIQGESGTGKELVARALHENSRRREQPFVPINCGALSENLLESELFGHVRGAFTGASENKTGWFERAYGGTIFLDEVAEMSQAMQVKLLRVLQTGEFSPVGSTRFRRSDVRVVAATNQRLKERVQAGTFREDVYYRLNVVTIDVPPLRERTSDIGLLAEHFLQRFSRKYHKPNLRLTDGAKARLTAYDFPGNVRELENLIERAVILTRSDAIGPEHLPLEFLPEQGAPLTFKAAKKQVVDDFERRFLTERLSAAHGNISQAARDAGMDVKNFFEKLKKHSIDAGKWK